MSILYMVAVKDTAVDAFMRPFFVPHRGAAIRSFSDEVNRVDSEMHRHPGDYVLYYVGAWDEQSGLMKDVIDVPELLLRGADCLKGGV